MSGWTEPMTGGCACGDVRYRLTREPIFVNGCHCRDCQKASGTAFAINVMVERDAIEVSSGEPIADAAGMIRCGRCRSPLWTSHAMFGDTIAFLRAGSLDAAERLRPDGHFFARSKHGWIVLPPDVPVFETLPRPGDPPLWGAETQARIAAAMAGAPLAGERTRG